MVIKNEEKDLSAGNCSPDGRLLLRSCTLYSLLFPCAGIENHYDSKFPNIK